MNVYHVERTDGGGGYDTYSDFVVVADNEHEARSFMPSWDGDLKPIDQENKQWGEWVTYEKTRATFVGTATDVYTKPTLICASFHAG